MPFFKYIILYILLPLFVMAKQPAFSAGSSSNLLLRFGSSARVSGFSEAFTGLADDENALFYNPGGLPNLKYGVLSFNHTQWLEDIRIDNLIYAHKLSFNSAVAVAVTHMWMPSIQGKDQFGQNTEMFDVSSSIVQIGFGYKVQRASYLGLNVKYFQDRLAGYNAAGFAFDAGFFMHTMIRKLTFGLVVQNLGSRIRYDQVKQMIPLTYRAGLAYRLFSDHLTITVDAVKSHDTDLYVNTGLEFNLERFFFLRIGNQIINEQNLNLTYGLGLRIKERFETHYTLNQFDDLGTTHRVGLSFLFNRPTSALPKSKNNTPEKLVPLIPAGDIRISLIDEQVLVSWTTVKNARYNLYVRAENQNDWIKVNSNPLAVNFLKLKKPKYAGKYIFKVTYNLNRKEIPFPKEISFDVQ